MAELEIAEAIKLNTLNLFFWGKLRMYTDIAVG